jgi:uncharacterized protein involved in exopolysaccharide biosynthesis
MDQVLDKSKTPSTSYRETFRRHRKLFCIPPILGALVAAFLAFGMSKPYKATANLWVDTAPPAPSSISAGSGPTTEPPAAAAQGLLSELLKTNSFNASVAESSLLGKSLGAHSSRTNAAALLGTGKITASAVGSQVLQLGYTASSPAIATSVLAAVIAQLRNYTDRLTAQYNQAAIAYDRELVKAAETVLATARGQVRAYQAQHPGVGQADPTYAALVTAQENAATQLAQANTALSQVAPPGTGAWSVQAVDPPANVGSAALSKKKMVEVIFGGALGGLLVSFLAVVALTPAKKEVWEDELPIGGPIAPNVAPADPVRAGSPRVPVAPVRSTEMPTAVGQARLSLGDRRFQFRTPSATTEDQ